MRNKSLVVRANGATADAIESAVAAARRVFAADGITPWQAALAAFERDGWEIKQFSDPAPSREVFRYAEVWEEAEAAARAACGADGHHASEFELVALDEDRVWGAMERPMHLRRRQQRESRTRRVAINSMQLLLAGVVTRLPDERRIIAPRLLRSSYLGRPFSQFPHVVAL